MAALAEAMKMAQAEIYEVATFYHHFDVVKEGETAPAALTVRVCEGVVLFSVQYVTVGERALA